MYMSLSLSLFVFQKISLNHYNLICLFYDNKDYFFLSVFLFQHRDVLDCKYKHSVC